MAGHANHDANAAAWAAMRAEQARAAEARRAERAAEKAARREANRAAWWGRMGREVPGAAEATEDAAEQTRRDEADAVAVFEVGMRSEHGGVSYTVERATASGVTVRTDAAGATRRQTLKVRRSDRGQYVKLNANSKAERVIYAADMAA